VVHSVSLPSPRPSIVCDECKEERVPDHLLNASSLFGRTFCMSCTRDVQAKLSGRASAGLPSAMRHSANAATAAFIRAHMPANFADQSQLLMPHPMPGMASQGPLLPFYRPTPVRKQVTPTAQQLANVTWPIEGGRPDSPRLSAAVAALTNAVGNPNADRRPRKPNSEDTEAREVIAFHLFTSLAIPLRSPHDFSMLVSLLSARLAPRSPCGPSIEQNKHTDGETAQEVHFPDGQAA
jgi:hypothetical protein